MKKKNIYTNPFTGCYILQSGLCQQFMVGSDTDPDNAWAPGRRRMSFKPDGTGS